MAESKSTTKKSAPRKRAVAKKTPANNSSIDNSEIMDSSTNSAPFKMTLISKKTKMILIIVVALILVGVIIFANRGLFIAAMVNGQPVSRLEVVSEIEKQYGAATLDRLVDKKLILQEAQKRNVEASQEELDKRRKEIVDQVSGGNEDNFKEILAAQGLTNESFNEELKIQIVAEKMLGEDIKVTDEELDAFLKANPDALTDSENEEETKKQIKEQLKQQKLQTEYTTFMENLRKESSVVRLVNY